MRLLILTILLIGLAFVLLGVKVLFVKGGKFPSSHVHASEPLRRRGITCASHEKTDNKNHYIKTQN